MWTYIFTFAFKNIERRKNPFTCIRTMQYFTRLVVFRIIQPRTWAWIMIVDLLLDSRNKISLHHLFSLKIFIKMATKMQIYKLKKDKNGYLNDENAMAQFVRSFSSMPSTNEGLNNYYGPQLSSLEQNLLPPSLYR